MLGGAGGDGGPLADPALAPPLAGCLLSSNKNERIHANPEKERHMGTKTRRTATSW